MKSRNLKKISQRMKKFRRSDEMIVLKDFSSEQLDEFLAFFKENGLLPVNLKAMLTPVTVHWDSLKLHDELMKEHTEMHSHK